MEGVQQGLGLRPDSKGRVGQLAPSPSTRSGEHCKLLEWGPGWTLCCPTSMLYFKCISGQHLLLNSRGFFCTKMLYSAMCKRLCQVLEAVWNSNCDSTLHQVQLANVQTAQWRSLFTEPNTTGSVNNAIATPTTSARKQLWLPMGGRSDH